MEPNATFYITTAIDYPSGDPHMGHAYEKIISDAYARWYRLKNQKVYFLTGTDENGQKLSRSAEQKGMETQVFVDEQVQKFKKLCEDLEITFDDFIRTTDERHKQCVHWFWNTLHEKGDIYFGEYEGMYCYECENFYPSSQAPDEHCPEHGIALHHLQEEGYFFRMSHYHDWILKWIKEHASFIYPDHSKKEILSRLEHEDLKDLSITRQNEGWGIPVPNDDRFVIYTWFDALINYYSALESEQLTETFWPASMHVIGKDIVWFHAVIWPIMLHACGIEPPKQVYVHGMVLGSDGRKMSKTLGNGVAPYEVLERYPLDTFRYYLLRNFPSGLDGSFSLEELYLKHNNELANDYGNLVLRMVKLTKKTLGNSLEVTELVQNWDLQNLFQRIDQLMHERQHHRALDLIWEHIQQLNQFLNEQAPWKLKKEPEKMKPILFTGLHHIRTLSYFLLPFIPNAAHEALTMLGKPSSLNFEPEPFSFPEELSQLFPRIEKE